MSKNAQGVKTPPDVAGETRKDALQAAEVLAQEHLAGWQRARADYENLRKRMDAERKEAGEAAADALVCSLLPIVDYFEAAIASAPKERGNALWTEGVQRTHQALRQFLKENGVSPIADQGVPLDPSRHEAIAEEESALAVGTITRVVAPGYLRSGRVLRPAKVKVSSGFPGSGLEVVSSAGTL